MDRRAFFIFLHGTFFVLVCGAVYHQILRGDYFLEKAQNNYIRLIPLPAERGTIFDRSGRVLARDVVEYEVSVIPVELKDKTATFAQVARLSNVPVEEIARTYRRYFIYPFAYTPLLQNIPRELALKIEESPLPAVFVTTRLKRQYLVPLATAHILGYVKEMQEQTIRLKKYGFSPDERIGYAGVEESYDEYLRGKPGGLQIEVDVRGRIVNFLGKRIPQKGKDIYLTIDRNIQESAFNALRGHAGALILMDVSSGEILAMVSAPSFDTNDIIEGKNVAALFSDASKPLLNRAIQAECPPGSIFKIVTAAAALAEKKLSPHETHDCAGYFNLGNAVFRCWSSHGRVDLLDALTVSCNVYFYNLGAALNKDFILKWARLFGLSRRTGIDLPYEKRGFVPSGLWKKMTLHEDWYRGDTLNLAIGQGFLSLTPIQALGMVSAVARRGSLVRPYLVKGIDELDMEQEHSERVPLPDNAFQTINEGLMRVVEDPRGTAHLLHQLGLKIAGKTGTAQAPPHAPHGWFIGFFPYDAPQYSITVFLEHGMAGGEAVRVAYAFLKEVKEKGLLDTENK